MENRATNYEKIGVYIAVMVGFLTLIFYLIDIKDDISDDRQRISKVEVKIEYLEEKK